MPRDGALWVITAFFNPTGSVRRLENYRAFRKHLNAPLLTVELSAAGRRQLVAEDADLLLGLDGEPFIWQKERLINIGINALPPQVEYVAWVDCDVLFQRPEWAFLAEMELEREGGLLQLFREAVHLPDRPPAYWTPLTASLSEALIREPSIGRAAEEGRGQEALRACYDPQSRRANGDICATGMALAARRQDLAAGLYDAAIVGGGDAIFMCAALNMLDEPFIRRQVNAYELEHIRAWAERARTAGLLRSPRALDQTAYHLWHGDLANRQYGRRHRITAEAGFDPRLHLRHALNGTWAWAEGQDALAEGVRKYFLERRDA